MEMGHRAGVLLDGEGKKVEKKGPCGSGRNQERVRPLVCTLDSGIQILGANKGGLTLVSPTLDFYSSKVETKGQIIL